MTASIDTYLYACATAGVCVEMYVCDTCTDVVCMSSCTLLLIMMMLSFQHPDFFTLYFPVLPQSLITLPWNGARRAVVARSTFVKRYEVTKRLRSDELRVKVQATWYRHRPSIRTDLFAPVFGRVGTQQNSSTSESSDIIFPTAEIEAQLLCVLYFVDFVCCGPLVQLYICHVVIVSVTLWEVLLASYRLLCWCCCCCAVRLIMSIMYLRFFCNLLVLQKNDLSCLFPRPFPRQQQQQQQAAESQSCVLVHPQTERY